MSTSATILGKKETPFKRDLEGHSISMKVLSELTKFRITFFVSVTTFVGYILQSGRIDIGFILPTLGVLILACGASALNEYQERDIDSKMIRTNSRPIPSGRLSSKNAFIISILLIIIGSLVLLAHNISVMSLGLFTLVWYNAIYTPLKKKTAFAIIPGSLVGALPPVIGWVAAGGIISDFQIISFALFMFIWQIPHFWLLQLLYDDQYKEAGYPTLTDILKVSHIATITFLMIVILAFSSGLLIYSGLSDNLLSILLLIISGIVTAVLSFKVITQKNSSTFKKTFLIINSYVLGVLMILSVENLL